MSNVAYHADNGGPCLAAIGGYAMSDGVLAGPVAFRKALVHDCDLGCVENVVAGEDAAGEDGYTEHAEVFRRRYLIVDLWSGLITVDGLPFEDKAAAHATHIAVQRNHPTE